MGNRRAVLYGLVLSFLSMSSLSSQRPTSVEHPLPRGPQVSKVGEEQVDVSLETRSFRVSRAYFDAEGRLRFDQSPMDGPSPCPDEVREVQHMTLMLKPRVDRIRCARHAGAAGVTAFLVGFGEAGKQAWQRPLGFVSGKFTIDEDVLGASPEGVVLSNLTVIMPRTGETLLAPPTHRVGSEQRSVPDHSLTGTALYLPARRGFLWFSADVTLIDRKGGLFFIDAATGRKELLLPVSSTVAGGYWRVESMALAQDDHRVLLAQRFAIRGPGSVSFAVFDLESRKMVYEDRYGEGHFCDDPQVVVGPGGSVGFAYLDTTLGKRALVHYRLSKY